MQKEISANRPNVKAPNGFQFHAVIMLSLCHFVHDIYSSFFSPLLPLLIDKHSLSLARGGFLFTIMQVPSLMNPLIGIWADRISIRWFIILAPSLTAVPMSLIGVAPGYGVLLLLFFITGVSVSLFHVPSPVMVAKLSGARKGRGMSFFMTGGELSRAIGPLVAVGGVSLLGLEGFYPVMILGLVASFWLLLNFKDMEIETSVSNPVSLSVIWKETRHLLLPLTGILFARGFMHAAIITFLPTFIKQESGNLWLAGISLTLVETAGVTGVLLFGSLSDTLGRRNMLFFSLIVAPIMLLSFTWFSDWLRFAALIATGFSLLSLSPVMMALVQENSESAPAAANGIYMMASFLARSSVVVIVGFLGDLIGLRFTFMLTALMGFMGIPFILMLPEGKQTARIR
ncbi:MAG: MFS transporter [Deltaproteobacteria bacterium]|nr:MFS transporter [Deltaproteobacteria bacterium]